MHRLDRYREAPVFSSALLPGVVRAILQNGPISRAQIARVAGLSKQTSSGLISALEQLGWVRESGMFEGNIGRRAVAYEFDPRSAYVLGIDLGGTKLHVALADHSGSILLDEHLSSDRRGGKFLVRQIGRVAAAVTERSGIDRTRLLCAVIGTPGAAQRDSGRILLAPNIAGLDSFDVLSALREEFGELHVVVENDVNLAAVGESWNGLSLIHRDLAFVALGTGVGMGLVSDGRLLSGANGFAGELSYLPIGGDPFATENLIQGTLEAAIGSEGIRRRYTAAGGSLDRSVKDIFDTAGSDPIAGTVVDDTARYLALALVSVVALVDPQRIVLGGSIGVRPELVERLLVHLPRCIARVPDVSVSRFRTMATTQGAIAVALNEIHRILFGIGPLSTHLLPQSAWGLAAHAGGSPNGDTSNPREVV